MLSPVNAPAPSAAAPAPDPGHSRTRTKNPLIPDVVLYWLFKVELFKVCPIIK
jgi:hypothetical protein